MKGILTFTVAAVTALATTRCGPQEGNRLDTLGTTRLRIGDQEIEAWIADSAEERERGLMFTTSDELASLPDGTPRGMLFVFPSSQSSSHGFWMLNVPISLDIAFVSSEFEIVTIRTMAAYDTRTYHPTGPYRYAIEVKANQFSDLGIEEGDVVEIPESVLKPQ